MRTTKTRTLVKVGLMTALVLVFTASISIPTPTTQGYIHLGDSMVFLSAILLGPVYGAIAAAVGSALADAYLGYPIWIIPTFIIKGVMAYLLGYFVLKGKESKLPVKTILLGIILCVVFIGATGVLINGAIATDSATLLEEVDQSAIDTIMPKLIGIAAGTVALIGLAYSLLRRKMNINLSMLIGMILAGMFMVAGYYIAAWILYSSAILPIFSIPGNVVQFTSGIAIAYFVSEGLRRLDVLDKIQELN